MSVALKSVVLDGSGAIARESVGSLVPTIRWKSSQTPKVTQGKSGHDFVALFIVNAVFDSESGKNTYLLTGHLLLLPVLSPRAIAQGLLSGDRKT